MSDEGYDPDQQEEGYQRVPADPDVLREVLGKLIGSLPELGTNNQVRLINMMYGVEED